MYYVCAAMIEAGAFYTGYFYKYSVHQLISSLLVD